MKKREIKCENKHPAKLSVPLRLSTTDIALTERVEIFIDAVVAVVSRGVVEGDSVARIAVLKAGLRKGLRTLRQHTIECRTLMHVHPRELRPHGSPRLYRPETVGGASVRCGDCFRGATHRPAGGGRVSGRRGAGMGPAHELHRGRRSTQFPPPTPAAIIHAAGRWAGAVDLTDTHEGVLLRLGDIARVQPADGQ